MNLLVLLEEAQKLVRMGSFFWRVDSNEVSYSESLRHVLEFDPSEPPSLQALSERFRAEDRERLMGVLRNEGGSGVNGAVFAMEREDNAVRRFQVRSTGACGGDTVVGTVLEILGPTAPGHELNNLLMVIQGNLDLIRMHVSIPEKIAIHLDLATHAVERLAALSEQMRIR